jgi:hypothetical protein
MAPFGQQHLWGVTLSLLPTTNSVLVLMPTCHILLVCACRQLKYPQYKGKRPPTPPGLHQQLACVLALVDAAGIPILAVPGVEADDVLGSLAARAAADGFEVVLVSPDKVRCSTVCGHVAATVCGHVTGALCDIVTCKKYREGQPQ